MDLATAEADAQQAIRRRASMLPPEERRSMIVAATLPLLVEHGEMVTTRQIADAAGIAEGTIFRVFADRTS
jgi:AcrR family transcriptional regulator